MSSEQAFHKAIKPFLTKAQQGKVMEAYREALRSDAEAVDLSAALQKVRNRAAQAGTAAQHGPAFSEGMRCAANMLESMPIQKSVHFSTPRAVPAGMVQDAKRYRLLREEGRDLVRLLALTVGLNPGGHGTYVRALRHTDQLDAEIDTLLAALPGDGSTQVGLPEALTFDPDDPSDSREYVSGFNECLRVVGLATTGQAPEAGSREYNYLMGGCTETNCSLCHMELYARKSGMSHAGISPYQQDTSPASTQRES